MAAISEVDQGFNPDQEFRVRTVPGLIAYLRNVRAHRRITQRRLGERVKLRQSSLAAYESGGMVPSLRTLLDWLFGLDLVIVVRPRKDTDV